MILLSLDRLRLHFRAVDSVRFPPALAGNTLRGAFGTILLRQAGPEEHQRVFAPRSLTGPSGLRDRPRPFVLRASHLDGRTIEPGAKFSFEVHLFDPSLGQVFETVFQELAREGVGKGRGRAELISGEKEHIELPASLQIPENVTHIAVRFVTPTELKGRRGLVDRPEFPELFSRLRDRVSALNTLYGVEKFETNFCRHFRELGERAALIRMTDCNVERVTLVRRSTRTGQKHPLGGFTGEARYEGELTEFLPYLQAGEWTGVGRQTTWGKGTIEVSVPPPPLY
jgi:CRISPR-associated endoribonuclease Cas6